MGLTSHGAPSWLRCKIRSSPKHLKRLISKEHYIIIHVYNNRDVFFRFLVAPRFPVSPAPVFVLKGHTAYLECKPESNPPPVITWLRDGQSLAGSGHQYIVNNVQPADEGSYTCNVKNSRGSTQGTVQLSIGSKSLGCLFHMLGANFNKFFLASSYLQLRLCHLHYRYPIQYEQQRHRTETNRSHTSNICTGAVVQVLTSEHLLPCQCLNRPLPSSKSSHFQNETNKCKTFIVQISSIREL